MPAPAKFSAVLLLLAGLGALAAPARANDAIVQLVAGFSFQPAEVTINVGESVTWINIEGEVHSTTNGTGYEDPEYGQLWDYWFFNGPGESVTYTFDSAGFYPYFCYPHLSLGMTGSVTVLGPSAAESSSWGEIKALFR